MKKSKKAMLGLAALAAVTVIGGTWAYWTQDLSAKNEFQTGKYNTDIVEEFTPPEPGEWAPGVDIEKKVSVSNTGDVKVAVAAAINQIWVRTDNILDEGGNPIPPAKDENFDLMFTISDETGYHSTQYAANVNWGGDVVYLGTLLSLEESYALGIETPVTGFNDPKAEGKWVLVEATNDGKSTNGFSDLKFIYNGIVGVEEGNNTSPMLLNSVTLNKEVTNTIVKKDTIWVKDADGISFPITTVEEGSAAGYDSAQYTMMINAITVQATESAIKDIFAGKNYSEDIVNAFITANKDALMAEKLETTESTEAPTVAS